MGHSSGAQLAILLALDPSWLEAVSEAPARLAGVVSLSEIIDLTNETAGSKDEVAYLVKAFPEPADRASASPMAHLSNVRPAMLVMTAARDIPGYAQKAAEFVEAARTQGSGRIERFVANDRDTTSRFSI